MSRLDELIGELCPDGVEYKAIHESYLRLRGTQITAAKMKDIARPDGNIRIFAGGKTAINAFEGDIPRANITRAPAVVVQSRGVIDFVYYDKPFTFKNEMWAYTSDEKVCVKFLYYVLQNNVDYFRKIASKMGTIPQISLHVTENFLVPVPPLQVHAEIVRILDKFTSLTAELQQRERSSTNTTGATSLPSGKTYTLLHYMNSSTHATVILPRSATQKFGKIPAFLGSEWMTSGLTAEYSRIPFSMLIPEQ